MMNLLTIIVALKKISRMSIFSGITLLLASLSFPLSAHANTLYTSVEIESLKQVKLHEKGGNQVYVNIFESNTPKIQKFKDNTLAPPPLHWQFLKKASIKKAWLWQGKLDEGDVTQITFIVHEKGFKPFNSLETIGSMMLELKNVQGQLQMKWANGEGTTYTLIDTSTTKFRLAANKGAYGIYEMVLNVKLV